MIQKHANLGTDTAWRRYELARRRGTSTAIERALRRFESNAGRINLPADAVHLAAEVAALEPQLDDDARIALVALLIISLAFREEGSTRFPVSWVESDQPPSRILNALLGEGASPDECESMITKIREMLDCGRVANVVGRGEEDFRPLLYVAPWIYIHRSLTAERALAARLAELLRTPAGTLGGAHAIEAALADVRGRAPFRNGVAANLTDEQCDAVAAAVASTVAVISGGPGTGKTSIIAAIARVLTRIGTAPDAMAIAAPTGKAAFRISEAISQTLHQISNLAPSDVTLLEANLRAVTLHRLLGYSPESGRFHHNRGNPLDVTVVIVDESSMVDLDLMEELAEAIKDGTRLILLGDADQLPSIAAGSVLRDLVQLETEVAGRARRPSVALLSHSFRASDSAGAPIRDAAAAIRRGETPSTIPRDDAAQVEFSGIEMLASTRASLRSFLDRWYRERLPETAEVGAMFEREYVQEADGSFAGDALAHLRRIFDRLSSARILCVARQFGNGSERINRWLHERAAESAKLSGTLRFLPGEPVIVTRNDYERGLFNGDQGVVLNVRSGGSATRAMAIFARAENFVCFPADALDDLIELSYAMTVHKAQGSEFDTVAILLPEVPAPILTRELLYTAVTRARKSVVLIGEPERMSEAVVRRSDRFSGLKERLVHSLES